jgi:signal peptidase I
MTISPKIPRIACIVAFVLSGLAVISVLLGQIFHLAAALVLLAAGIGILRRRVWSAYGFSLYLFAQLLIIPFVLVRAGGRGANTLETTVSIVLTLSLAFLYLLAGRSLDTSGARRGWAWPWIALAAVLTVPFLFIEAFNNPSGAMEDTLLIGDRVLVRCFPAPSVARGDLVALRYPVDRRQKFIKRVIGIPGDRIKISGKIVYRNGAPLKEPYAVHKDYSTDLYRDNFPSEPTSPLADAARDMLKKHVVNGEVVVPERSYFVLGDNRDRSLDSRYWGFVDESDLIGEPFLIYGSEEEATETLSTGKPTTPSRIRWGRFFKLL